MLILFVVFSLYWYMSGNKNVTHLFLLLYKQEHSWFSLIFLLLCSDSEWRKVAIEWHVFGIWSHKDKLEFIWVQSFYVLCLSGIKELNSVSFYRHLIPPCLLVFAIFGGEGLFWLADSSSFEFYPSYFNLNLIRRMSVVFSA